MAVGDRDQQGASTPLHTGEDGHRARLIDAITRAATERGYSNTTVDQVARYAGVSPETFSHHFSSMDQCLVAAQDSFFERLMDHIAATCDDAAPWPLQVKTGVGATLGFFSEVAGPGRVFVIESLSAGPAAIERRFAAIDRLAALLRPGRRFSPAAAELPAATEHTLVAGVGLVISRHLLAEEGPQLPAREAELTELVLTPYVGNREAKRIATA